MRVDHGAPAGFTRLADRLQRLTGAAEFTAMGASAGHRNSAGRGLRPSTGRVQGAQIMPHLPYGF
ncbi:MAG: hypothetical protein ACRDXB_18795, partial [Actinomycetes bacterium]